MGKLRGELEDLAFRYTDPYAYEQLTTEVDALRAEARSSCTRSSRQLEAKLKEHNIRDCGVEIKRLYSIQQKLATRRYRWVRSSTSWRYA